MIKSKLLKADEQDIFYCNNCKSKFTSIYTFQPIPGLQEFYNCKHCGGIMPLKDLKTTKKSRINCCSFCFFPSF